MSICLCSSGGLSSHMLSVLGTLSYMCSRCHVYGQGCYQLTAPFLCMYNTCWFSQVSFRSYWTRVLLEILRDHHNVSIKVTMWSWCWKCSKEHSVDFFNVTCWIEIWLGFLGLTIHNILIYNLVIQDLTAMTSIRYEDVVTTLQTLNLIKWVALWTFCEHSCKTLLDASLRVFWSSYLSVSRQAMDHLLNDLGFSNSFLAWEVDRSTCYRGHVLEIYIVYLTCDCAN